MTTHALIKQGLCDACDTGRLAHGPWTAEQITAACEDLGVPEAEFGDWCDHCFVEMVAGGDAAYAQSLITDRKLQLDGGAA